MRLKIFLLVALSTVESFMAQEISSDAANAENSKNKRGILDGYGYYGYGNIGNIESSYPISYLDSTPAASGFAQSKYVPRLPVPEAKITQSQVLYEYQQTPHPTNIHQNLGPQQFTSHPQSSRSLAYTQYLQTPSPSTPRYLQSQAETVVTPVQHSTIIHHTPHPYNIGRYVYLNAGKTYPQPHQGLPQIQLPLQQQHPLQKPLHVMQQSQQQRFRPSQQIYPNTNPYNVQHAQQAPFVPIKTPQQQAQVQPQRHNSKNHEEKEEEREAAEEEEEDEEEKSEINEDDEEDEEEQVGRYRDDEEEDEEEERPRYANYSFSSKSKSKDDDDEDEEDDRGRYRTHEDVEEDEEDDSNEDSSRFTYKKTPKNYSKFEKRPPLNKARPIKSNYERYTFSKGRNGKPKIDGIQGRPSHNVPVTVQKVYKEKWYITRKA